LLAEALAALQQGAPSSPSSSLSTPEDRESAALQLRAQLHYRLGDAAACVRDYEALLLPSGGRPALARHADTQAQLLEIKTNSVAAHVAAGLGAQVPQLMAALKLPTGRAAPSYEAEYNRACALAAREVGDLAGAEAALRHALRLGTEALQAEELAEEEVLDELAPVSAQLAYVTAAQGRPGEALERLEPLVAGELSDAATAAVAAVNHAACTLAVLAAGGGAPAGDAAAPLSSAPSFADPAAAKSAAAKALKRLEHAISDRSAASAASASSSAGVLALRPDLLSRLSPAQQRAVHLSRALLLGLAGRVDQAREVASALAKQQQQASDAANPRVPLLLAALLARAGKAAEAEAALPAVADTMEQDGDAAIDPSAPVLLRAQLAAEAGDAARAADLLAELPGGAAAGLAPGVLATRVVLLERAGRGGEAEALLERGLEYWQQQQQQQQQAPARGKAASSSWSSDAAAGVGWCLQRLVALKLAAGKTPEAMALFQQLMSGTKGSAKGGGALIAAGAAGASVVARLARAAAAAGDAASVAQLARQLPGGSAAAVGAGLDTDALEDVTRVLGARARRAAKEEAAAAGAAAEEGEAAAGAGDAAGAAAPSAAAAAARKRSRRKRKPRYPAGYDASKGPGGGLPAPDPERWLPKWQRSNFKKQQRRRHRDARDRVVGSQGAGKVDEALDRTKAAAAEDPAAASSSRPSLPPRGKGRPRK
jgi:signal recognition particle subunit SRP72